MRWSNHRIEPCRLGFTPELVERLLRRVGAPGGKLIACSCAGAHRGQAIQPMEVLRSFGYRPKSELAREAPEGAGTFLEMAAL